MVLETIITDEVGEETVYIEHANGNGSNAATKLISTPMASSHSLSFTPTHIAAREDEHTMNNEEEVAPEDERREEIEVEAVEEQYNTNTTTAVQQEEQEQESIMERDFDTNPTLLFALLQKKEWKAAMERCHEVPEECQIWVTRKEKENSGANNTTTPKLRWRLLPIHAAIVFQAPESVLATLLHAHAQGAAAKDDQGMLPLHLAFRNGASEATVHHLLVAHPSSIDLKDRKGRTPLTLAQASTSPHKDAYLRALEQGVAYYQSEAAKAERTAFMAEQEAIFQAKVVQWKQSHQHELAALQLEAQTKMQNHVLKIQELERELIQTQETSQVLVDHVNSLEAQLNTRSDTERFLATKIATLDASLQTTEKNREEMEQRLRMENYTLLAEKDGYQSKLEQLEHQFDHVQAQLQESLELFAKREQEWSKTKTDLESQVKAHQLDWANAAANCAILDVQLKKKMETEHALATQVSALAGKLAEHSSDARDQTTKYHKQKKEMEEERIVLRTSVQDLTQRLQLVATLLEDMGHEQTKIIDEARFNDFAIASALDGHAKIVAEAQSQSERLEEALQDRKEMQQKLLEQEEMLVAEQENRTTIMKALVVQGEHMAKTKGDRESMLQSVKTMGDDIKGVIENILSVLPPLDTMKDAIINPDQLVDAVVKSITSPATEEELTTQGGGGGVVDEETKEMDPEMDDSPDDELLLAPQVTI